MNPKRISLFVAALLLSYSSFSLDPPCYDKLFQEGKSYLLSDQPQYEDAFLQFMAARSCWDKVENDSLDFYINLTTTQWAKELEDQRLAESVQRELAEQQRAKFRKQAAISSSFNKGYESQKALERNESGEALKLGFDARKNIENYNNSVNVDSLKLSVPSFAIEAFGNAVFAYTKKWVNTGHPALVALGVTSSGDRFYTIGRNTTALKIWDRSGQLLDTLTRPDSAYIYSASFSADGKALLACYKNGTSRIWRGKEQPTHLLEHATSIIQGVFLADGKVLTIDRKGGAQLWGEDGKKIIEKKLLDVPLLEVKVNTSRTVAIIRSAYRVFIWPLTQADQEVIALPLDGTYLYGVEVARNKEVILTVSATGEAQIWNFKGQLLESTSYSSPIFEASLHQDGQSFIGGLQDGRVVLQNYEGKAITYGHPVEEVMLSSDGKFAFSYADSIFNITGQQNFHQRQTSDIKSACFSPDSQSLLISTADQQAKLWALDGQLLMTMPLGKAPFRSVFLEAGKSLLSVSENGALCISAMPSLIYEKIDRNELRLD